MEKHHLVVGWSVVAKAPLLLEAIFGSFKMVHEVLASWESGHQETEAFWPQTGLRGNSKVCRTLRASHIFCWLPGCRNRQRYWGSVTVSSWSSAERPRRHIPAMTHQHQPLPLVHSHSCQGELETGGRESTLCGSSVSVLLWPFFHRSSQTSSHWGRAGADAHVSSLCFSCFSLPSTHRAEGVSVSETHL